MSRRRRRSTTRPRANTGWGVLATLGTLCGALGFASGSASDTPTENQLRAVFVYRFTQMIEWPASALGAPGDPITLCGLGEDPTDGEMEKAVAGQRSHDRALTVRWIDAAAEREACQALYIAGEDTAAIGELLEALADSPVLTIGDAAEFAEQGGMIELRRLERRMQFEINRGAIERAGLGIQTKLLGHAAAVYP